MKTVTINKFVISFIVFIVLALINALVCESAFDVGVFEVFYSGGKTGQTVTDSQNQGSDRPTSTISTWIQDDTAQNGEPGGFISLDTTEVKCVSNGQTCENPVLVENKNPDSSANSENIPPAQTVQITSPTQSENSVRKKTCVVEVSYPAPFSFFMEGKYQVEIPETPENQSPNEIASARDISVCNVVYPARERNKGLRETVNENLRKNRVASVSEPESQTITHFEDIVVASDLVRSESPSPEESTNSELSVATETPVLAEVLPEEEKEESEEKEEVVLEEKSETYHVAKPSMDFDFPTFPEELESLENEELAEVKPAPAFGIPDAVDIAKYGQPATIAECPEDGIIELAVPESENVPPEEQIWPEKPRKKETWDFPQTEE